MATRLITGECVPCQSSQSEEDFTFFAFACLAFGRSDAWYGNAFVAAAAVAACLSVSGASVSGAEQEEEEP